MVQLSFLLESSFVTLIGIVAGVILGLATASNVIADSQRQPSWSNVQFPLRGPPSSVSSPSSSSHR
jgi:ABC-type antimicrobial peptide transport system permease subunit